jgi:hypothetical protein
MAKKVCSTTPSLYKDEVTGRIRDGEWDTWETGA